MDLSSLQELRLAQREGRDEWTGLERLTPAVRTETLSIILDMARAEAVEEATETWVDALRTLHDAGASWTYIGEVLGVDRRTLTNWRAGRVPRGIVRIYTLFVASGRVYRLNEWLMEPTRVTTRPGERR